MSNKELRDALLRGHEHVDLQALTEQVLKRDRRRMWVLGIVCVIAWMMVVMLPWSTVLPMMAKVARYQLEISNSTTQPSRDQTMELLRILKTGTMATFFGTIASMFIAAICTVSLIISSRRATLRQVNARLSEISRQIQEMKRPTVG